jgi:hypothetical protein
MMKNPRLWVYEVLPLINNTGEKRGFGIMHYLDDGACKFHLNVSPFGPLRDPDFVGIVTTPEELIADGWVVD